MPEPEINVSALLRLKRYEQPPPGYFDQLLKDIHRRQRAELLRRPLWKIALDRMQTYFSEHSMGGLSYAGAMAAVVVVGFGAIGLMMPSVENAAPTGARVAEAKAPPSAGTRFTLRPQPVSIETRQPLARQVAPAEHSLRPPRYVIDARPVSYDPPSSF
jgi:hypothetical protein